MQFFSLITSLFLVSGFYYIGKKITYYFKLNNVISEISDPIYQYTSLGIVLFLIVFYPIFFLEFYNQLFFLIISIIIIFFGIYNFFPNLINFIKYFKNKLLIIKKNYFINYLVIILILLYFLISITPVTSGNSVSYHLGAAKFILQNGYVSKDLFSTEAALVGSGEFLNTFAIAVNAYQFTSLINFIGIVSVLGIIAKFSSRNKIDSGNKNFLFLCILSSPVLVF